MTLSGLILAGGRSSRMGRDKAGLTLPDGRTLLQRQADTLRAAGAERLLISAREDAAVAIRGAAVVRDAVADAGPLAGIAAGLRAAPEGLVIVLAVDMPGIEVAHLRKLLELASPDCGVVPTLAGRCEPLIGIYPAALAESAEIELQNGRLAVHAWVELEVARNRMRFWEPPAEWAGVLRSWNTAADIAGNR